MCESRDEEATMPGADGPLSGVPGEWNMPGMPYGGIGIPAGIDMLGGIDMPGGTGMPWGIGIMLGGVGMPLGMLGGVGIGPPWACAMLH